MTQDDTAPNQALERSLEHFESIGIMKSGHVSSDNIETLSLPHLQDLVSMVAAPPIALKKETSIFAHCAAIALGGGRQECEATECRIARVNELAQYAAML